MLEGERRKVIEVKDIWYRYPGGTLALQGISLEVCAGEFIAIIGQNGAGKTTLTKQFNALLRPTKGDVIVDGVNTKKTRTAKLAKKVGYVFQNPDHQIFCESVWDEVAFGPKRIGFAGEALEETVTEALNAVGLYEYRDQHPYALSKGHRQRVAVASILAMRPEILVIDEPTTGQDYRQSHSIMDLLRNLHQAGRTVLVVTHDMTIVAEYSQRTILMGLGQILADGDTRDVLSDFALLERTWLRPPQITLLGAELKVPHTILTVREMHRFLMGNLYGGVKQ